MTILLLRIVIKNTTLKCIMKRVAFIGGASSGKTTLITALEKKGYEIFHEVARGVLEERKKKLGEEYNNPSYEELYLRQKLMFKKEVERLNIKKEGLVFCDRGLPSYLAYSKFLLGEVPSLFAEFDFRNIYSNVFCLERFPLKKDGIRFEKNDREVQILHDLERRVWEEKGYDVVDLPIFSLDKSEGTKERIKFVLKRI
jgi:predicted ATPase